MPDPSAPTIPSLDLSPAILAAEPVPPPLDAPAPPGAPDAPASRRNAGPLLAVLHRVLPADGTVLEIGTGTGQHAVAFAAALAPRGWLPTDRSRAAIDALRPWVAARPSGTAAPLPFRILNAADAATVWPIEADDRIRAIVAANVIHIAPWAVAAGLLAGAAHWLAPGDPLVLYGPFKRDAVHTGPGNAAFDADLKARDRDWGIRDLEREIGPAARDAGLAIDAIQSMPADNLAVVLRRAKSRQ